LAATRCAGEDDRRYRHLRDTKVRDLEDCNPNILYTIEDSFFNQNRILTIDTSKKPPLIVSETRIVDENGVFQDKLEGIIGSIGATVEDLINGDGTVNIDPEGIAVTKDGGFWLAHEGSGTASDGGIVAPNILFRLSDDAVIQDVIFLPDEVNAKQIRFGFEGVAEDGQYVVVAFQRAWEGEPHPRIGIYDTEASSDPWSFLYYPLDAVESQFGGWVGLSDIAPIGCGRFLVLERDNQGGPDAAIKRIYEININYTGSELSVLNKILVADLLETLKEATNGPIVEKVEGLTVDNHGNVWINNDNDGLDDNSGENLLLNLGDLGVETCIE